MSHFQSRYLIFIAFFSPTINAVNIARCLKKKYLGKSWKCLSIQSCDNTLHVVNNNDAVQLWLFFPLPVMSECYNTVVEVPLYMRKGGF